MSLHATRVPFGAMGKGGTMDPAIGANPLRAYLEPPLLDDAAELVACECVVLAETKDHFDWELIGECAKAVSGGVKEVLQGATDQVEDEEDAHLYHTKGWCRELWLKSLGLPAVLPPPEEKRNVKTAEAAAKVEKQRKK